MNNNNKQTKRTTIKNYQIKKIFIFFKINNKWDRNKINENNNNETQLII